MNHLKHILGIPITLSNGLSARGSSLGRSAGSNGKSPKRCGNIVRVTGDGDSSTEPKFSNRSYAKIIADYSKAIEARYAATKLNGESNTNTNKGFFSKAPFQHLTRVSSLVNIKNAGTNGGSSLCTKSSSRPPDSFKTNDKTFKSKVGLDETEIPNQVTKRAEWLNHIIKVHNAKRMTKSYSFSHDSGQSSNLTHYLVQKHPASSARNDAFLQSFNDSHNSPVKKFQNTLPSHVNCISKFSETRKTIPKSISDTSVHHSLSVKKLPHNSTRDANIVSRKSNTTESSNPKSFSSSSGCYRSSVKRGSDTLGSDTNIVSNKSSTTESSNSRFFNDATDRYCSSVKKVPDTSASNVHNISVVIQRLQKTDTAYRESSTLNSEDSNTMLLTVTEESTSSTSKSFPLQHIDFRINGKPATGVDTVISRVNMLNVVSSAEKIEITIPVLSKTGGTVGDNVRAPNSTINLCISSQGIESKDSNDVRFVGTAGQAGDVTSEISKSSIVRPSRRTASKIKNSEKVQTSVYKTKVVPWWTSVDSFRRCEKVNAYTPEVAAITRNEEAKTSGVRKLSARDNQETHDRNAKEMAVGNARKAVKFVVTESSNPKQQQQQQQQQQHHQQQQQQQQYIKKRSSVISNIIANESRKKSKRDEQERQTREQLTLGRSKSDAKPEAKPDTKVRSTTSNESKKESTPVTIGSTMLGKSARASTPTPDELTKKMASSAGITVTASGRKSMTAESEPKKGLDIGRNNNLSSANNFQGKIRAKPISEIARGNSDATKEGGTTPTGQVSVDKAGSKLGTKPRQEITSKSETNAAPQFPRTYGKIKLLPSSECTTKSLNRASNNRHVLVTPSDRMANTSNKLSNLKNSTITMRPIEKKNDGTLIDYGLTVNTRKKPERKLSGPGSATGLQGKKRTRQKESPVIATIKEVMPRRNENTRINAIEPRGLENAARSRLNGADKNRRRISEIRITPCRPKNIALKGATNEPNESTNSKTSMKCKKKNSKDSNESQVVEAANPDKKLLYSVWLRRFQEQTGQDPDSTKDPSSRNS